MKLNFPDSENRPYGKDRVGIYLVRAILIALFEVLR